MVIGPGKGQVAAFVILGDGEYIPEKFNNPRVVVYRKGWMTFGELQEIKPFGQLAKPEDLAPAAKTACNYSGDGQPLHQHEDESWWYFDAGFSLENGPFPTYELALKSLSDYCKDFQEKVSAGLATDVEGGLVLLEKFFTMAGNHAKVVHDEDVELKEGDLDV